MTRVALGERLVTGPVHRYEMSSGALSALADRVGVRLPWLTPRAESDPVVVLVGGAVTDPVADPMSGADAELRRLGLLDGEAVHVDAVTALAGSVRPRAHVGLDLRVRCGTGPAGLQAWHRLHRDGVTGIVAARGSLELAWWPVGAWADELSRTVAPPPRAGRPADPQECPAAYLRMPYELLLASGPAVRDRRDDLLTELLWRYDARVHGARAAGVSPQALTAPAAREQMLRLHTADRGRLRVTVAGGRTAGLVSWVLFADGWRELVPVPGACGPEVVVRAVAPAALGTTVARMVAAVVA